MTVTVVLMIHACLISGPAECKDVGTIMPPNFTEAACEAFGAGASRNWAAAFRGWSVAGWSCVVRSDSPYLEARKGTRLEKNG